MSSIVPFNYEGAAFVGVLDSVRIPFEELSALGKHSCFSIKGNPIKEWEEVIIKAPFLKSKQ